MSDYTVGFGAKDDDDHEALVGIDGGASSDGGGECVSSGVGLLQTWLCTVVVWLGFVKVGAEGDVDELVNEHALEHDEKELVDA